MTNSPLVETGVLIRPLGAHELEAIHELDVEVFGQTAYPYFVLRQLFDLHLKYCLVAEGPDGGLCGYTLAVPSTDPGSEGRIGWIVGLGVREGHRRNGCGRKLIAEALGLLERQQVRVVKVTVEPDNASAIALYEEFQFRSTDLKADYLGPGEDRLLMEVRLPRESSAPGWVTDNYHQ